MDNKNNKPQFNKLKKYLPPEIISFDHLLKAETRCESGSGAGGGPCELPCLEGSGPGAPEEI